jgi:hypothetical protein
MTQLVPVFDAPGELTTLVPYLKPQALELPGETDFETWDEFGHVLRSVAKASNWWLGDWVRFGETKFEDRYLMAMDITGLEYDTVKDCVYVAGRFPPRDRHEGLTFTHHRRAAVLPTLGERKAWLGLAFDNGWSSRELHLNIRQASMEAERSKSTTWDDDATDEESWYYEESADPAFGPAPNEAIIDVTLANEVLVGAHGSNICVMVVITEDDREQAHDVIADVVMKAASLIERELASRGVDASVEMQ